MKQMNMWKKVLAFFTIASMITVHIPLLSFAEGETAYEDNNITLSSDAVTVPTLAVDFLGTGVTPAPAAQDLPHYTKTQLDDAAIAGDSIVFWIGVSAELLNDSKANAITQNGLYGAEIGFDYNPEYVQPCIPDTGDEVDATNETDWVNAVTAANITADMWQSGTYEVAESYVGAYIDSTEGLNRTNPIHKSWHRVYTAIERTSGATGDYRFQGTTDAGKQYLLKLPFKLLKAPSDGDPKPIVIELGRGPSTLSLMLPPNGDTNPLSWREKEEGPNSAATNLNGMSGKNGIFAWGGDTDIFGDGATSSNITALEVVSEDATATPQPTETSYPLYDSTLTGTPLTFDPATNSYYTRVPADITEIKIKLTGSVSTDDKAEYTDQSSGNQTLTFTQNTGTNDWYTSAAIPLVDTDPSNVYNDIKLTLGGAEYHVYVQKLVEAKITLAYGNSPYGEIMKMEETTEQVTLDDGTTTNKWSDAFKAEAKKKFAENNFYDSAYMPTSVVDSTGADLNTSAKSRYTVQAWTDVADITAPTPEEAEKIADPEINMDRNDKALFVFNGTPFVDPGVTVLDEFGMPITTVERSISFTRMGGASGDGVEDAVQIPDSITATGASANYLIDGLTNVGPRDDGSVIRTRPGIYTMTYKATTAAGKELFEERKVVVLQPLGDTNFSNTINDNDTNAIIMATNLLDSLYDDISTPEPETNPAVKRLIVYKVFDTNFTDSINDNDANSILEAYNYSRMVENQYIELPEA